MPYIDRTYRASLDQHIDPLAEAIRESARARAKLKVDGADELTDPALRAATTLELAGFLNYACSRLAALIAPEPLSYSTLALLSGVFRNVADEFYRRVAVPYENEQIKTSGDIYPEGLTGTSEWDPGSS